MDELPSPNQQTVNPVVAERPKPKRFWLIITVVLLFLVGVVVVLSYGKQDRAGQLELNNQTMTVSTSGDVSWADFFPRLSSYGSLVNNRPAIPSGYERFAMPAQADPLQSIIWGMPADIKKLSDDPEGFSYSESSAGMFEVNISMNVGVNEQGQFESSDGTLSEEKLSKQDGITDVRLIEGTLAGTSNIPVAAVTANLSGKPIYLAYVGIGKITDENTVMMISFKGGQASDKNTIWQEFTKSLGISN